MKKCLIVIALQVIVVSAFGQLGKQRSAINPQVTAEELKLYSLIIDYRRENNLPPIPLSKSLTFVAQTHCKDLAENRPDDLPGCNAHSWSAKGAWSACCYTSDHKQAKCMWSKPKELTNYSGVGYEIAHMSSVALSAEGALHGWKESKFHNDVIMNTNIWNDKTWNAIGIGVYQGFAVVWFGDEIDPEGNVSTKSK